MKITIEIIPHNQQRYDTEGDWQWDGENLNIKISEQSDWKYEILMAIHEFVEAVLCKQDGVSEQQVDDYDFSHPEAGDSEEDMSDAPYLDQHSKALTIERMLCHFLNVNWAMYNNPKKVNQ